MPVQATAQFNYNNESPWSLVGGFKHLYLPNCIWDGWFIKQYQLGTGYDHQPTTGGSAMPPRTNEKIDEARAVRGRPVMVG